MADRSRTNEIAKLQSEITDEISRDGPEIAMMVFGEARDQPDVVSVSNERLDRYYRSLYESNNRTKLQEEARRDPAQFLKVAERIGVQVPQVAPGMQSPVPATGAFARAAAAPALPAPSAPVMPAVAPASPVMAPPMAPAPVILGPNGQPLPPSGAF